MLLINTANLIHMKKKLLLALFLLCFCTALLKAQTTIILQPGPEKGKDALIHGLTSQHNRNYGDNEQLMAAAWTFGGIFGQVRSAFQFDLSELPFNAVIVNANLSLFAWSSDEGTGRHAPRSGSNACWIKRITIPWQEESVNWNQRPSTTEKNKQPVCASIDPDQDYININVTTLVQDMLQEPDSSFGFLIELQNERAYRLLNFSSSDHPQANRRPRLEITYIEAPFSDVCTTLKPDAVRGKDALLHGFSQEVNRNYGNNDQLAALAWRFGIDKYFIRSLLNFDWSAIPTEGQITSARLSLYAMEESAVLGQHATANGSNAIWLQRVLGPWSENSITWNEQPVSTKVHQVAVCATTDPNQNIESIDVTRLVQDIIDKPDQPFGFLLRLQEESPNRRMNFASSDHEDPNRHPQLEVCYIPKVTNDNKEPILRPIFKVFPNPAQDFIQIQMEHLVKNNWILEVLNEQGQLVKKLSIPSSSYLLDVSDFPKGFYYLKAEIGTGIFSKKIVIQ